MTKRAVSELRNEGGVIIKEFLKKFEERGKYFLKRVWPHFLLILSTQIRLHACCAQPQHGQRPR